ncbi:exodeoxyribonuclease VII small subunit [Natranaerovirga pectinivora]|uniref:Exodeoxyribonuclease 7 small subunit n=1 Tax=Natranaerovirga pectinivora TaxID=682400 RepID=A0A4R3MPY7_9FIRM|nr:exodeoxyribonuclease VII small subunit [Natranaerovirga pectinivora]TCT16922.1 exodeoxyribonuclease VII small subunit [Natranaerovirga pectinivora]
MAKELKFEEALENLEKIIKELEEEDASLEDSIVLYKKGNELLKYCTTSLEQLEKEILIINEEK